MDVVDPQKLFLYPKQIKTRQYHVHNSWYNVQEDIVYTKNNRAWWRHQMETFFRVTGALWGELTGHRWIPLTKASDA